MKEGENKTVKQIFSDMNLIIKYLLFDVEATHRELTAQRKLNEDLSLDEGIQETMVEQLREQVAILQEEIEELRRNDLFEENRLLKKENEELKKDNALMMKIMEKLD